MNITLFGIQGSGKGTQGELIAKNFEMKLFETGAELRKIAAQDSKLGKKVKNVLERGELVPNKIVMEVIENFLENNIQEEKILFDGIPRSLEQKKTFDQVINKFERNIRGILINISEEEAKRRLLGRRICQKCKKIYASDFQEKKCQKCDGDLIKRSDDNEKAILKRIENFNEKTMPVIKKYQKEAKLISINGEQEIKKVYREIEKVLTNL